MPIFKQISFWQINPQFTSAEKVEELNKPKITFLK